MPDKMQIRAGTCPNHGSVHAQRRLPGPTFPFLIYALRRQIAARRPYRCPDCSTPVVTT
jgi:hypothetical protein